MNEIVDYIGAKGGLRGSNTAVVFVDGGFAESLKWHGRTEASANLLVLSLGVLLNSEPSNEAVAHSWMKLYKPLCGIFLISTPLRDALPAIKKHSLLLAFPECVVLTTSTHESTVLPDQPADIGEPYAFAIEALLPSRATINYFPLHVVPILPPSRGALQVFALSSPGCRTLFPATLGALPHSPSDDWPPPSVHHIDPADLPYSLKVMSRRPC